MKHLSPEAIVDLAEGCAEASAAAHAAACDECRANADAAAEAIRAARAAEGPEPSPLFWTHLAARIGGAVRREPARVSWWRAWAWRAAPAAAAAVLVLAVGLALRLAPAPAVLAPGPAAVPVAPFAEASGDSSGGEPGDDASWLLMSLLSSDVSMDDAAASGVWPGPGGTEQALVHLDDAERSALAEILRAEMAGGRPQL
jgi:hypothetical protein